MVKVQDIRHRTPFTNSYRNLSSIKKIARHYSATTGGNFDSFWKHWNGVNGWGTGGYHEIILRDGTVQLCYDPEQITNGVGGQNSYIYNICLVGLNGFTKAQEKAWEERARYWMKRLGLSASDVLGHNEFPRQSTACPGINMNVVRSRLKGNVSANSTVFYLQRGDTGEKVGLYQDKFKRAGYSIVIDRSFGPDMEQVVKQFQKDNGLAVDGSLGPDTQRKLDEVLIAMRKESEKEKEVDELTIYMDEKLPKTQQKDAADLFKKAHEDGYFSVNHAPNVKGMTRRQYLDLRESLQIREKLNKKVK